MSSENASILSTHIEESTLDVLEDNHLCKTERRTISENRNLAKSNAFQQGTQHFHLIDQSSLVIASKNGVINSCNNGKALLTDNSITKMQNWDITTDQSLNKNDAVKSMESAKKSTGPSINLENNVEELSETVSEEEIGATEHNDGDLAKNSTCSSCIKASFDSTKIANDKLYQSQPELKDNETCTSSESKSNQSQESEKVCSESDHNSSKTQPFTKLTEIPSEDSLELILPQKIQVGFRNVQVNITSIDTMDEFILCGTNAGCGYLYNRETGHLMKLACEARNDVIKAVKLFIGIECQLALATADGKILIIIISSGSAPNTRRVQKFTLGTVHSTGVTCLEWSTNGMKLFSGDKNGNVYLIERDFEKNRCQVSSFIKEENEIVNLSYKHKVLLVSTTERSLLFNTNLPKGQKITVGSRTRQGVYGGCFGPNASTTSDLQIFCTRPGYRIWVADVNGKVTKTLIFKDLVASSHSEIKLTDSTTQVIQKDNQFRRLMFFQEKYLLASSDSSIFVIDPSAPSVLASCQNFSGLMNISITKNEIFVLCKNRKIHRISEGQDEIAYKRKRLEEENMSEAMKKLQNMKNSFAAGFSLQALQSKMSSINEEAEQWSNKLQSQAKALQQKLPTIGSSLFSGDSKSESSDQHVESVPMATNSAQSSPDLKLAASESESENRNGRANPPAIICEEIEKDLKEENREPTLTSVNHHFEKIEEIGNQETIEIVHHSRRKRTKNRSPSFNRHSDSDEPQKSPLKAVHKDSTKTRPLPNSFLKSEDNLNIIGAHALKEKENEISSKSISPIHVEQQHIENPLNSPEDNHEQESVPQNSQLKTLETPTTLNQRAPVSVNPVDGDLEAVEPVQQEPSATNINKNMQKLSREPKPLDHELESSAKENCPKLSPSQDSPEEFNLPVEKEASAEGNFQKEETMLTQENPLSPPTRTPKQPPAQGQALPLNREVVQSNPLLSNIVPVKIFPNAKTSSNSKIPSSCESAELSDGDHSLVSSSDDIYAVDTATRDFESELDSEDEYSPKDNHTYAKPYAKPSATMTKVPVLHQRYKDIASVPAKLHDSWSTKSLPHRVTSISASGNFIWFTDYFYQIYFAEELFGDAAIKWKKLKKTGTKLCVSHSGDIMWLLGKKGTVYAGVMPTDLHLFEEPLNFYWTKVTSNISCIALGHGNAWVVTNDGVIKSQLNLSRTKSYAETWNLISWPQNNGKVVEIAVTKTMVWCRSDRNSLYRSSIEDAHESGATWEQVLGPTELLSDICSLTSDSRDTIFVIDTRGVMSFLSGDGKLWQVNVSEFMDEDQHLIPKSIIQSLPQNVATSVHKVQRWMARPIEGQCIAVSNQSIWIVHDKYMAAVAKGPITGHRWDFVTPLGVSKSSKWRRITTSSIFSPDLGSWVALVWASRPNGEIFCFSSQEVAKNHPVALPPATMNSAPIICMSACKDALWVLYENGKIYIRSGVVANCLQGVEWSHLDTTEQLGDVKITHISCGTQHVWAVDSEGQVLFRIGVGAVDPNCLPPAWIPVDGCPVAGRHFTQIECGLSDSSIWAIDNFSEIYVRIGVSPDMPIGTKWEVVPGSRARQICISNHTVWGLRTSGNIIQRFGISQRNQMGNYWKKVIGRFIQIAATPYDELWAIDETEHLRHLSTTVYCPIVVEAQYQHDEMDNYIDEDFAFPENVDKDWEIL